MLADFPMCYNLPAADLARAKQFYAEKLGLHPVSESPIRMLYTCAGSSFAIVPSESAGAVPYSLMTWYVDDLAATMAALRGLGVRFEEYDMPWLKTEQGVASLDGIRLAWFKDSEGNLLALGQLASAA